ncbi:MAG: hypothetical protein N2689_12320 [Verrucomicrobiae bacterium]|nr:hypothetical protein [Verrucomicrobiae bacterium]
MVPHDINGDGKLDFVTSKRLFTRHERGVSCYDPLFGLWYEVQRGRFAPTDGFWRFLCVPFPSLCRSA